MVNPFDTPPTFRQAQGGEQGRTTGRGLLRVDGERHTNKLPSSPEPQAEGTPCTARLSSPKSARGMSRTVKRVQMER